LTLAGNNTYTGATTVNSGTLRLIAASVNNIASSQTVTVKNGATLNVTALNGGAITLASGQTLAGGGTVTGGVVAVNGSRVAPGMDTLTVASLNMASGSVYDYQFSSTAAHGVINVSTAGGLTINGGGFNLYNQGRTTPFATPGTYKVLQYSGTIGGGGVPTLSVLNPLHGMTYAFVAQPGEVDLTLQPATPLMSVRLTPPPFASTGTKDLVIYTHGYGVSETEWNDSDGQWGKLNQALHQAVAQTANPSEWTIMGWDWTSYDGGGYSDLLNGTVLNRAQEQGRILGKLIAEGGFQHVHFIGHSAGSALISAAAAVVADKSKETTIHTTYLSPFAKGSYWCNLYGAHRPQDWSDSYIAQDDLPWTTPTLPNSHNVDVTWLDTKPYPNGPLGPPSSHGWPIDFYLGTIPTSETYPIAGASNYGYARSLEGGGWDTRGSYPLGKDPVVLGGPGKTVLLAERQDTPLNFSEIATATSSTGMATVAGTTLTLATGSPVWIWSLATVDKSVNTLTFNASFPSNGAEGLLAVYWDNQYVGQIDQRYVLDGSQQYSFMLPSTFDAGAYSLAFRLDPYTDTQSSVAIDSVSTGFAAVPEPSTFILLAAGLFGVLAYAWRRRRLLT
jgi:hypothetical protein